MVQLADAHAWVKAITVDSGKVISDGAQIWPPTKILVRYTVANDSHVVAGPLTVVGSLTRNGVKVTPNGQANVVPSQQITLQPNTVWKKEWTIAESDSGATYVAKILADVGNWVNEDDESNNKDVTKFEVVKPIA